MDSSELDRSIPVIDTAMDYTGCFRDNFYIGVIIPNVHDQGITTNDSKGNNINNSCQKGWATLNRDSNFSDALTEDLNETTKSVMCDTTHRHIVSHDGHYGRGFVSSAMDSECSDMTNFLEAYERFYASNGTNTFNDNPMMNENARDTNVDGLSAKENSKRVFIRKTLDENDTNRSYSDVCDKPVVGDISNVLNTVHTTKVCSAPVNISIDESNSHNAWNQRSASRASYTPNKNVYASVRFDSDSDGSVQVSNSSASETSDLNETGKSVTNMSDRIKIESVKRKVEESLANNSCNSYRTDDLDINTDVGDTDDSDIESGNKIKKFVIAVSRQARQGKRRKLIKVLSQPLVKRRAKIKLVKKSCNTERHCLVYSDDNSSERNPWIFKNYNYDLFQNKSIKASKISTCSHSSEFTDISEVNNMETGPSPPVISESLPRPSVIVFNNTAYSNDNRIPTPDYIKPQLSIESHLEEFIQNYSSINTFPIKPIKLEESRPSIVVLNNVSNCNNTVHKTNVCNNTQIYSQYDSYYRTRSKSKRKVNIQFDKKNQFKSKNNKTKYLSNKKFETIEINDDTDSDTPLSKYKVCQIPVIKPVIDTQISGTVTQISNCHANSMGHKVPTLVTPKAVEQYNSSNIKVKEIVNNVKNKSVDLQVNNDTKLLVESNSKNDVPESTTPIENKKEGILCQSTNRLLFDESIAQSDKSSNSDHIDKEDHQQINFVDNLTVNDKVTSETGVNVKLENTIFVGNYNKINKLSVELFQETVIKRVDNRKVLKNSSKHIPKIDIHVDFKQKNIFKSDFQINGIKEFTGIIKVANNSIEKNISDTDKLNNITDNDSDNTINPLVKALRVVNDDNVKDCGKESDRLFENTCDDSEPDLYALIKNPYNYALSTKNKENGSVNNYSELDTHIVDFVLDNNADEALKEGIKDKKQESCIFLKNPNKSPAAESNDASIEKLFDDYIFNDTTEIGHKINKSNIKQEFDDLVFNDENSNMTELLNFDTVKDLHFSIKLKNRSKSSTEENHCGFNMQEDSSVLHTDNEEINCNKSKIEVPTDFEGSYPNDEIIKMFIEEYVNESIINQINGNLTNNQSNIKSTVKFDCESYIEKQVDNYVVKDNTTEDSDLENYIENEFVDYILNDEEKLVGYEFSCEKHDLNFENNNADLVPGRNYGYENIKICTKCSKSFIISQFNNNAATEAEFENYRLKEVSINMFNKPVNSNIDDKSDVDNKLVEEYVAFVFGEDINRIVTVQNDRVMDDVVNMENIQYCELDATYMEWNPIEANTDKNITIPDNMVSNSENNMNKDANNSNSPMIHDSLSGSINISDNPIFKALRIINKDDSYMDIAGYEMSENEPYDKDNTDLDNTYSDSLIVNTYSNDYKPLIGDLNNDEIRVNENDNITNNEDTYMEDEEITEYDNHNRSYGQAPIDPSVARVELIVCNSDSPMDLSIDVSNKDVQLFDVDDRTVNCDSNVKGIAPRHSSNMENIIKFIQQHKRKQDSLRNEQKSSMSEQDRDNNANKHEQINNSSLNPIKASNMDISRLCCTPERGILNTVPPPIMVF